MSRSASGVMSLPAGIPVVTGTPISSSVINAALEDIRNELTDSLSRSGRGGMTVPFLNTDGSEAEPGVSFTNDEASGLFRDATGVGLSYGGDEKMRANATGVAVTGATTITGDLTVSGTLTAANTSGGVRQLSASSGSFSHTGDTTSAPITDGVNPISVELTTTGRSVMVGLQPFSGSTVGSILLQADAGAFRSSNILILRDGVAIARMSFGAPASQLASGPAVMVIDAPPAAGTYTYTAQIGVSNAAASVTVSEMALVACEL